MTIFHNETYTYTHITQLRYCSVLKEVRLMMRRKIGLPSCMQATNNVFLAWMYTHWRDFLGGTMDVGELG